MSQPWAMAANTSSHRVRPHDAKLAGAVLVLLQRAHHRVQHQSKPSHHDAVLEMPSLRPQPRPRLHVRAARIASASPPQSVKSLKLVPTAEKDKRMERTQLMMMCYYVEQIADCPARNICGGHHPIPAQIWQAFYTLKFSVAAVVNVAVEPKNAAICPSECSLILW